MQMICQIPVLLEKQNCHANFIHTSRISTNDPFLTCSHFVLTNQRTVTNCHNLDRNACPKYRETHL